jgi:DNA-binding MarR family transcriptional regulator
VRFRRGIWLELFAINQLLYAAIDQALEGEGREFALYSTLWGMGEATPTQISETLGLPLATASDRLNRMVERGHATREVNPDDRRSYVFRLTPTGLELTRAHGEQFGRLVRRVRGRMSVDEEQIRAVLDDIEAALRQEFPPDP